MKTFKIYYGTVTKNSLKDDVLVAILPADSAKSALSRFNRIYRGQNVLCVADIDFLNYSSLV